MLGNEFEVLIPNLDEIRSLESKMDIFKEKRKEYLQTSELGKIFLNKIERKENSNFFKNEDSSKDSEDLNIKSKELNLEQVIEDKANVDSIWKNLDLDVFLNQSRFIFNCDSSTDKEKLYYKWQTGSYYYSISKKRLRMN